VQPDPIKTQSPLADIQGLFAGALVDVARRGRLLTACRGDERLVVPRFEPYRNNLRASWEKALSAAYPVLQRYVGVEFFSAMSAVYGLEYPSRSGDLNRFGPDLPSFVERFAPLAEHPWLPDLARLEWAVHASHYAADAGRLAADAVAQLSKGMLDTLPVDLHPTCRLVRSNWDIAALWLWHQTSERASCIDEIHRPVTALVFRPLWKVAVRSLGAGEATGLARIAAGAGLGDALEAAYTAESGIDVAAVFSAWLRDGLLIQSTRSSDGAPARDDP